MFRRKSSIGLDIGSSTVTAVQLRRSGRSVELEKFGLVPIFPSGRRGEVNLREARVAAIRRALDVARINAKNVVSAVSGEAIIVRYIQLPEMTETELNNALKYEAEEYIPFHIDEVELDSHILGRTEEGQTSRINVLLVAAKKELVAEHTDLIRQAGLVPEIVDVGSFALFNCFTYNYQPGAEDVVALVDIGAEITNINVYYHGTSQFARDINIGGDTITNAIQQKIGVEFAEAEQLKFNEGVPYDAPSGAKQPDQDGESSLVKSIQGAVEQLTGDDLGDDSVESQAARIIKSSLNVLVSEIRRSLQFFENQTSGRPVTQIIITGGTAKLRNLDEYLRREFGIPVEIFDPLRAIRVSPHGIDTDTLANCRDMLGVGIGLALRKVA